MTGDLSAPERIKVQAAATGWENVEMVDAAAYDRVVAEVDVLRAMLPVDDLVDAPRTEGEKAALWFSRAEALAAERDRVVAERDEARLDSEEIAEIDKVLDEHLVPQLDESQTPVGGALRVELLVRERDMAREDYSAWKAQAGDNGRGLAEQRARAGRYRADVREAVAALDSNSAPEARIEAALIFLRAALAEGEQPEGETAPSLDWIKWKHREWAQGKGDAMACGFDEWIEAEWRSDPPAAGVQSTTETLPLDAVPVLLLDDGDQMDNDPAYVRLRDAGICEWDDKAECWRLTDAGREASDAYHRAWRATTPEFSGLVVASPSTTETATGDAPEWKIGSQVRIAGDHPWAGWIGTYLGRDRMMGFSVRIPSRGSVWVPSIEQVLPAAPATPEGTDEQ